MSEVVDKVKYRRPLNKQQLGVLYRLYWYRFCTSKQLARSLERSSPKVIQNKLQILEEQGFIGKRYDKSYKLAGRPAEYYITPKGARELEKRKPDSTNQWATKSLYKNKTVSDDFLKHTVAATDTAQHTRAIYGDKLWILPKSYMVNYSFYPKWTPDLHLKIPKRGEAPAKHYFVDMWDGTKPFFVSVRKTRNYVNFKESGDWQEDEPYPAILAICEDAYTQKKLNRQMKRILNDAWDDDLVFATTTRKQFEEATKPTDKIWLKVDPDDEAKLLSLAKLTPKEDD
ncbi:replication-relaxation family protein [Candidatus Nomurabacteria bacterium]|nr:replication-relaxation family protein [Candidatus Nomurabacteria bacterium]